MGSQIEIRLTISEDELAELRESLDNSVIQLSDELDECMTGESGDVDEIANRIKAAQSVKCKLAIHESECMRQNVYVDASPSSHG